MAKVHPVEKELSEAYDLERRKNETDKAFQKRLHEAATSGSDKDWENLSEKAQAWVNAVTDFNDDTRATYPETYDDVEAPAPDAADDDGKGEEEGGEDDSDKKSQKGKDKVASKSGKKSSAKKDDKKSEKKAPAKKSGGAEKGYKGHRAGSRKEAIHQEYDKKGADAAMKLADKKGIKAGSARSWIGSWGGFKKK